MNMYIKSQFFLVKSQCLLVKSPTIEPTPSRSGRHKEVHDDNLQGPRPHGSQGKQHTQIPATMVGHLDRIDLPKGDEQGTRKGNENTSRPWRRQPQIPLAKWENGELT